MSTRGKLRRSVYSATLVAAGSLAVWEYRKLEPSHPHMDYLTGWILLVLVLYLTAYNARKKLAFLPLVNSRRWMTAHSWVGMIAGLVFLMHLRCRMPAGPFEAILASLFVAVTLSGIVGWWLSRVLPPRLTSAGGEVPYERIPIIRRSIRERAEALVLAGIPAAGASTLADFYAARLGEFFKGPANFGPHLFGSSRTINSLLADLGQVQRYLSEPERKTAAELGALLREKDTLDLHWSVQLVLKGWLFIHIPLTYGMLVFIAVHIVLVYAYSGGAR
jgi:hypothetical protein